MRGGRSRAGVGRGRLALRGSAPPCRAPRPDDACTAEGCFLPPRARPRARGRVFTPSPTLLGPFAPQRVAAAHRGDVAEGFEASCCLPLAMTVRACTCTCDCTATVAPTAVGEHEMGSKGSAAKAGRRLEPPSTLAPCCAGSTATVGSRVCDRPVPTSDAERPLALAVKEPASGTPCTPCRRHRPCTPPPRTPHTGPRLCRCAPGCSGSPSRCHSAAARRSAPGTARRPASRPPPRTCPPRTTCTRRQGGRRSRGCTDSPSARRCPPAPRSPPDTLRSWPCPVRRRTRSQDTRCRARQEARKSRGCTDSRSARRSWQAPASSPGRQCTPPCPARPRTCSLRTRRRARRAARRSRGCTYSLSARRFWQTPRNSRDMPCTQTRSTEAALHPCLGPVQFRATPTQCSVGP